MKRQRWWWIAALAAGGSLAALIMAGSLVERFVYAKPEAEPTASANAVTARTVRTLEARIKAVEPRGLYIVIDTAANRLLLKRGDKTIKEFVISCGSGGILEDTSGGRKWIFETPRGEYAVQNKLVNPTWIKPDWAFIEEGEKIPSDYNERIDNDTLGDFALGFGNGYFIHGTLYTRLLGRNVTHGCVRVGDKDLKEIYQAAGIGTRIYIY
ncbi:MAG: L,D-transpeptidase [Acidobacteriota bacterium]|nr:L,D-transpeptidase [Acidobacteriota bacterium]